MYLLIFQVASGSSDGFIKLWRVGPKPKAVKVDTESAATEVAGFCLFSVASIPVVHYQFVSIALI